jgi:hypothetical protein
MIRIVIENIILLLLPTLVYFAYIYLTVSTARGRSKAVNDAPLLWLFVLGACLVLLVLLTFGSNSGSRPGDVYTPPVFRDGKIVPGKLDGEKPQDDGAPGNGTPANAAPGTGTPQ